ncbi:fatty acid-binding protein 12-like [Babylonia areolata]|uniref:fatty acid-binding protein 12-like n=1 Tax=Babylonia areolata TaxID=304850 RepID=UPI003FD67C55
MAEGLIGKWQSVSYENMEPFWDAMGVPEPMRQFARERKTELTIEKEGEGWKLTTVAGDKSRVIVFPVGQEVDTITLMGHPVKATLTVEDGQLVERQATPGGEITIKRSLVDGSLKTNMTAKGVTAGINFTKV